MTDERVTWRDRAFPDRDVPLTEVGAQGWHLLDGDFHLPVVALRETAIERNLALMRDYCTRHDVLIAPHAKTTMSPALVQRQLATGAWGITVANVQQAKVFITAGVRRVLVANPVVGPADLAYLAALRRADPDLEVLLLVDSVEAVALLVDRVSPDAADLRPQPVLVELGYAGGRGGVRSTDDALRIAQAVRDADGVELVGIEGFEGLVPGADLVERRDRAADFLDWSATVVRELIDHAAAAWERCRRVVRRQLVLRPSRRAVPGALERRSGRGDAAQRLLSDARPRSLCAHVAVCWARPGAAAGA